jgi:cytoskeleton protein RodZ
MTENLGVDADDSRQIQELSPGEMLLQGRLQTGLTQEQVAKELYMTVYKVKALETDDYTRLNSDTFARGYIRAYATLVKIDVVAALGAYDKLLDNLRPQALVQKHEPVPENTHRGAWQFLAIIGVFFFLLWLISVWFFDNHSESQYVIAADSLSSVAAAQPSLAASSIVASEMSSVRASESSVTVSSNIKPGAAIMGNASSINSVNHVSARSVISASVPSASASVAAMQSSLASSKKTSLDELHFSFRGESWLEVSDSRGDVLATELEPVGSNIKLVGMAPFDVKLGNAAAVDVQLNGKKIDVIPLMGSKTLILKIGN